MVSDEKDLNESGAGDTGRMTEIVNDHKVFWIVMPIELPGGEGAPVRVGMSPRSWGLTRRDRRHRTSTRNRLYPTSLKSSRNGSCPKITPTWNSRSGDTTRRHFTSRRPQDEEKELRRRNPNSTQRRIRSAGRRIPDTDTEGARIQAQRAGLPQRPLEKTSRLNGVRFQNRRY